MQPRIASSVLVTALLRRAEAEGGTLVVVSPSGRGTVITATLPLDRD